MQVNAINSRIKNIKLKINNWKQFALITNPINERSLRGIRWFIKCITNLWGTNINVTKIIIAESYSQEIKIRYVRSNQKQCIEKHLGFRKWSIPWRKLS